MSVPYHLSGCLWNNTELWHPMLHHIGGITTKNILIFPANSQIQIMYIAPVANKIANICSEILCFSHYRLKSSLIEIPMDKTWSTVYKDLGNSFFPSEPSNSFILSSYIRFMQMQFGSFILFFKLLKKSLAMIDNKYLLNPYWYVRVSNGDIFQWAVSLQKIHPLRVITSNHQGPLGASFHIKKHVPTELMILYAFGFRIQKDPESSWIFRTYQFWGEGRFYWCLVEKSPSTRWEWKLCSDCLRRPRPRLLKNLISWGWFSTNLNTVQLERKKVF